MIYTPVASRADLQAGLTLFAMGALGLWLLRDLPVGQLDQMGPAFFPGLMCIGLVILGIVVAAGAFSRPRPARANWQVRPLAAILTASALFMALLESIGLFASVLIVVLAAAQANRGAKLFGSARTGAIIALLACGVFGFALRLPMPIWPVAF